MPSEFDVFLSFSQRDNQIVEEIGEHLHRRGLRVWLSRRELRPGFPWQSGLEDAIRSSRALAVFVGDGGLGAWQEPEVRAFLAQSRKATVPVIPVFLPGCGSSPQLMLFLEGMEWVDLREGLTEEGIERLVWGITGKKLADGTPATRLSKPHPSARQAAHRNAGTWLSSFILSVSIVGVASWIWSRDSFPPRSTPPIYSLRVQVVNPEGLPVSGSTVQVSTGSEPQRLLDGWWEVEIPAAKVPISGQISVWVQHKDWSGSYASLRLARDSNPSIQIRLKEPASWLRGRVVDENGRDLAGVRVSRRNGPIAEALTNADGFFEMKLDVPTEGRVRLRAQRSGSPPRDVYCYTGRDICPVVLEEPWR